ncbi:hypothetical protein QOT17_001432 [Balamuthia mandrillaris]
MDIVTMEPEYHLFELFSPEVVLMILDWLKPLEILTLLRVLCSSTPPSRFQTFKTTGLDCIAHKLGWRFKCRAHTPRLTLRRLCHRTACFGCGNSKARVCKPRWHWVPLCVDCLPKQRIDGLVRTPQSMQPGVYSLNDLRRCFSVFRKELCTAERRRWFLGKPMHNKLQAYYLVDARSMCLLVEREENRRLLKRCKARYYWF